MLATMLHLPKWLVVALVFCVVTGHWQQVQCKLVGCSWAAADACAKAPAKGDPCPMHGKGDCAFHCHLSVSAPFENPLPFIARLSVRELRFVERITRAPEAPSAEIEYPPQSVTA